MTAYTGIQGQNILITATDPSNPVEGQIWYNTTSNLLKGYALISAAWASAPSLNTARWALAGVGTNTAALVFGGYAQDPVGLYTSTESYNGSSWTTVNSLSPGKRNMGQTGVQTAALAVGGGTTNGAVQQNNTQTWNGTSWTTGGNYPVNIQATSGAGTNTAGLFAGGYRDNPPGLNVTETNTYNGTSFTTVPANLNTATNSQAGNGTQTTAIIAGGGPAGTATETYNGTSWTTRTSFSTPRGSPGGAGDSSLAIIMGGESSPTPLTAATELWNGTSWTATSNMSAAISDFGKDSGSASAAFQAGGYAPGGKTAGHQQYTAAALGNKTITTS